MKKLLCWLGFHQREETWTTRLSNTQYAYLECHYGRICLRCGKALPPRVPTERLLEL